MTPISHLLAPAVLAVLAADIASAQGYSLLTAGGLFAARPPLVGLAQPDQASPDTRPQPLIRARSEIPDTAEAEAARGRAQSLFIDRAAGGLFAPVAPRDHRPAGGLRETYRPVLGSDSQAEMLRQLIAHAEAGPDGYDAVQYGATRKPDRPPSQMTLDEIFAWVRATPGQPHAVGRYQFIPSTLARLADVAGASRDELFSPQLQDRLADDLVQEAGLDAYRSGAITRHEFMNNLAQIWAGLPTASGRSYYDGYAGNAATITWSQFDSEMARIFEG